jgi:glycosyltransferase involved in cell wall biosynthesis
MYFNLSTYPELSKQYKKLGIVSVSNDQRKHAVGRPNFIGTIYHGIPKNLLKFVEKPTGKPYLVFLGRIDPIKQPDWAIKSNA